MLLNILWISSKFIHFTSLFFLLTSSFFFVKLIPPNGLAIKLSHRLFNWQKKAIYLLAISSITLAIFQIEVMGFDFRDFKDYRLWLAFLSTNIGKVLLYEIIIALFALFFLPWLLKKQVRLCITSLTILIPLAELGHSAINTGWLGILQRINQVIHLLSAAYWSAGLILICYCLPYLQIVKFNKDTIQLLKRFSFYGHFAVLLVVTSGLINTMFVVGIPYGISNYTILLTTKIILVSFMVTIAVWNRYFLIPRLKYSSKYKHLYNKCILILTSIAYVLSLIVLLLVAIFATMSPF